MPPSPEEDENSITIEPSWPRKSEIGRSYCNRGKLIQMQFPIAEEDGTISETVSREHGLRRIIRFFVHRYGEDANSKVSDRKS